VGGAGGEDGVEARFLCFEHMEEVGEGEVGLVC